MENGKTATNSTKKNTYKMMWLKQTGSLVPLKQHNK